MADEPAKKNDLKGLPPIPGMSGLPGLPGLPGMKPPMPPFMGGLPGAAAPAAPLPPAAPLRPTLDPVQEYQKKVEDLEKRLSAEREKVLLANLKSQEEKNVAARVETSIKEIQDKLRRDRRDAQTEESRLKLEAKVAELESRLVQERETWVATLRNQMQTRDSQNQDFESHFTLRVQEMERRWLEEKAGWQKTLVQREEDVRRLTGQLGSSKELEAEHKTLIHEKKTLDARVNQLMQENAELQAHVKGSGEREREFYRVQGELTTAREAARMYQERYEREMQALRMGGKEREQRLLSDVERLQHDLSLASQKVRMEYEAELRRVRAEADGDIQKAKAQGDLAGAALQRMRAVGSALEKQVASLRMQAEENKKLKDELQGINDRYKAEFLVLQRKWQDREAELRREAEKSYEKRMEAERAKIKLRAQEEIQARVLKAQEGLRKEMEGDLAKRERAIRGEAERVIAEKARDGHREAEEVRRRMETELERKSQEASKRETQWTERLIHREAEMAALKGAADDLRGRMAKEEEYKLTGQRERIELEKSVARITEKSGVLQGTIEDLRRQLADAHKFELKLESERKGWENTQKAYEEKLKDFDRHAKELENRLNEAARSQDTVNDEKVKLQEAVAKVESEHSRQLETWRRKLNLVRNDMEGRVNSLQAELDAVRGENVAMKSAGPIGWLRRLTGGDKPQPPVPPR